MPRSKKAVNVPIATPRRSSGTRLTTSSASDGNSSEKPAPIATAPDHRDGDRARAPAITSEPGRPRRSAAPIDAGDRAEAVGQPAAEHPHRDHAGGERGEDRGAVADARLVEVEDDERGHRRVADDRQREAEPGPQRLARDPAPLGVAAARGARNVSGIRSAIAAPASGAAAANAQTASKLVACRISSPSGGPSASPPQIASP